MEYNDKAINDSMHHYYEERAAEYELVYQGGWPASINDPTLFQHDAAAIAGLLPGLVGKNHLDLACGTGYWLQFYHAACSRITAVDQSANMLDHYRRKIAAAGIESKTECIQADVLTATLPHHKYDSVLIGFLWSHLTGEEEKRLFAAMKNTLRPEGRLLIIDSAWSPERAATREKQSIQTRTLTDGRDFYIRKRYLDNEELSRMEKKYAMAFHTPFSGKAFMLAAGTFLRTSTMQPE